MEPFDRAWFGYCPSGRIPCDDYGIPNVQLNWRHAQGCRTFPDSKSLKKDANSRTKTERMPAFKITWAQMCSRDTRFIFQLHTGVEIWPLFAYRDTFRQWFDLGFHDEIAASKSTTRQKGLTYADTRLQKKHHGTCVSISNPCLITWYSVSVRSMMLYMEYVSTRYCLTNPRNYIKVTHGLVFKTTNLNVDHLGGPPQRRYKVHRRHQKLHAESVAKPEIPLLCIVAETVYHV